MAVKNNFVDVALYLRRFGADATLKDGNGRIPIQHSDILDADTSVLFAKLLQTSVDAAKTEVKQELGLSPETEGFSRWETEERIEDSSLPGRGGNFSCGLETFSSFTTDLAENAFVFQSTLKSDALSPQPNSKLLEQNAIPHFSLSDDQTHHGDILGNQIHLNSLHASNEDLGYEPSNLLVDGTCGRSNKLDSNFGTAVAVTESKTHFDDISSTALTERRTRVLPQRSDFAVQCSLDSSTQDSLSVDTLNLARDLRAAGETTQSLGPITRATKSVYIVHLKKLQSGTREPLSGVRGKPLYISKILSYLKFEDGRLTSDYQRFESELRGQFSPLSTAVHEQVNRMTRNGLVKGSFNYLLMDPRKTQNLPLRYV